MDQYINVSFNVFRILGDLALQSARNLLCYQSIQAGNRVFTNLTNQP
jgi:hypothetical protein